MPWITTELFAAPITLLKCQVRLKGLKRYENCGSQRQQDEERKWTALPWKLGTRVTTDSATLSYQILHRQWGSISADSTKLSRGLGVAAWSSLGGEALGEVKNEGICKMKISETTGRYHNLLSFSATRQTSLHPVTLCLLTPLIFWSVSGISTDFLKEVDQKEQRPGHTRQSRRWNEHVLWALWTAKNSVYAMLDPKLQLCP